MPKVSIVTCTWNRGHLIGETIASVQAQSFTDYEYIIVDDGSDDNTEAVVASFHDSRIQYYKHTRTGGHLSLLRNLAHSYCKGEYIAYIDSDDRWDKEKLELQISMMERSPHLGFSFTDICTFDESGILRKSLYNKSGQYCGNVFQEMMQNKLIICHTTLVIRSSCLAKTGPMDEAFHSGDHDLVFFLSRYFDALILYKPLVWVRKHSQNSTGSNSLSLRLLREHHRTLDKLLEQNLISRREHSTAIGITSYSFGLQALAMNELAVARQYLWQSLKQRPFYMKAWLRLAQLSTK